MTSTRFVFTILAAMIVAAVPPAPACAVAGTAVDAERFDTLLANDLTRQELVGLYRALQVADFEPPACESGPRMFTDVPATSQFCPWIEELARRGVTGGCTETEYCPGNPVTRAQMAAFLVRALEAGATHDVVQTTQSASTLTALDGESLDHDIDGTWVGNGDNALLALAGPAAIDGAAYGLRTVEVCINATIGSGFLSRFEVWSEESGGPIAVESVVQGEGCHALDVLDAAAGHTVHLVGGSDSVRVSSVRATWVPVEELP